MRYQRLATAALLGLALTGAQANVTTSTSGLVTTYVENFNGGTSFSAGWFNALGPDDYLWLSNTRLVGSGSSSSSYTFSSAVALSNLTLDFWYSSNVKKASNDGSAAVGSLVNLLGSTGNILQVGLTNPGPNSPSTFDSQVHLSFDNLAAGNYTLKFKAPMGQVDTLKVDDVTITTTAVPEPRSGAMLLAGLGALAFIGHRRKLYS